MITLSDGNYLDLEILLNHLGKLIVLPLGENVPTVAHRPIGKFSRFPVNFLS